MMKKNNENNGTNFYHILLRIFREYVCPEIKTITRAIICLLIIAITTAMNAWLMQPVLDDVLVQKKHNMLLAVPLAILINSIIKGVADFYQSSSMKIVGQKIIANIQMQLYSHLIYSDLKLFHDNSSAKLLSRFTNEIHMMKRAITEACTSIVRDFVTLLALIGLMFYQSISMSMIFVFIFPLTILPIIRLGRRMRNIACQMQDELGIFATRLDETFKNIAIIKSYCREKYELGRAKNVLRNVVASYKKAARIDSATSPIMEVVGGIAISIAIWYGGTCVLRDSLTPGEFFSFITALLMCYRPLKSVSQLNTIIQEGLSAANRLFILLDQKPLVKECSLAKDVDITSHDITFKNISFAYKKGKRRVLRDFNMRIESGQTVALVGTSGVGKSTILQLLQRFYDPDVGVIMLNKYQIRNMKLEQLRNSIAFVSQDIVLFDETIDENIRYGRMDATDDEVMMAAKAAAAHDFIIAMPEGYNTNIGQAGLKISGGQKQRIAIARAILKNAPILLLDEATSALDAVSETKVQQALDNLKKGRTTIVIAHRLSTVESADMIYVIADGKATESGTHRQLLRKSALYNKLYSQYKSPKKFVKPVFNK